MPRYTDLMELKNDTMRMNVIRERLSKFLYDAVVKEFGEDFTKYINKQIAITPSASPVPKNTTVVDVGPVLDKDKFEVGVCAEIIVKVKKWNTVETKSGKIQYGVTLDDYEEGKENEGED